MKEKKNFFDKIIDGLHLTKHREIIMYLIFGVLTTDTVDQAMARSGLKGGNKGADCAESAVEMVNLYKELA